MKCCLCGNEIGDEYGHNPEPLMKDTDKNPNRCCTHCNFKKVIPARLTRTAKESRE